jgi:hypothetical protein
MPDTLKQTAPKKELVNVLGVVYVHTRTSDGGDLYLTRFAEGRHKHLRIKNWYEKNWFNRHKERLLGTSSVFRVPTRKVNGKSLDLVVKNCRVGEDVPLNTHTLKAFCDREFNSPWEEFSLVMEMREGLYGPTDIRINTHRPLAIYMPPEKMQLWQSGRSRAKINRIRARHPGIDLDILKQYKLVYEWIPGKNLIELFEGIDIEMPDIVHHVQTMYHKVMDDLSIKGYLVADMKPEHVIIEEEHCLAIEEMGRNRDAGATDRQVEVLYRLIKERAYSVIDFELLFRTPEHEDHVKSFRRHSYLDDMRNRNMPTLLPTHLSSTEVLGVPYVYGHAESTGGHLWVVGRNARLFDYFLPERWRKTPALSLSNTNEVFYTMTKDSIHLVWKTSRVGELPMEGYSAEEIARIKQYGINSPFEEFAIAHELNQMGIPAVYVRAIYMTGGKKLESSMDMRKYDRYKNVLDEDGTPVLQEDHNYITIRGYYNGPDEWVPEHEDKLYTPIDLDRALGRGLINESLKRYLLKKTIDRLGDAGYDGTLLRATDLLLAMDDKGNLMLTTEGEPHVIICDFELVWKMNDKE